MGQFEYGSFRCGDESGSYWRDFCGKDHSSKISLHFHPLDKPHALQCNPALCLAPDRLKKEVSLPNRFYLWLAFVCL